MFGILICFISRIRRGEQNRVSPHYFCEQLIATIYRSGIVIKCTAQTNDSFCRFGNIDIYIGTKHISFQVDIIIETALFIDIQYTLIRNITAGNVITSDFTTTTYVKVGTVVECIILE